MQNWRTSRCQAEIIQGVYQWVLFVSFRFSSECIVSGLPRRAAAGLGYRDTVGHFWSCVHERRQLNGEWQAFHGLGLAGAGGSPCITVVESLALPSWWAAVTWIRKRAIFWWALIISAASWIVWSPKDALNDVVFAKRCPVLTPLLDSSSAKFRSPTTNWLVHSFLILFSQSFYPSHHVVLITVVAVITVAAVTGIGNI